MNIDLATGHFWICHSFGFSQDRSERFGRAKIHYLRYPVDRKIHKSLIVTVVFGSRSSAPDAQDPNGG